MTESPANTIERELAAARPPKDTLLTVGVFDGVHLGHQSLVNVLRARAAERNLLSGLVTFKAHPRLVVHPTSKLLSLTGLEDRLDKLRGLGLDIVVALSFTTETSRLGARDFVALLQKHLRMRGLVIGPDFALGRKREGNAATLKALGKDLGFTVEVIQPFYGNGEIVSSTLLRHALAQGDVIKVHKMLGHPFYLRAPVVHGQHRGIGFPTINQTIPTGQALPVNGVYATVSHINGQAFPSVTNIGTQPTFGANPRTVETYILDFEGDLYGKMVQVDFMQRLRGEIRFSDPEQLKDQISRDVEKTREVLGSPEAKEGVTG